MAITVNNVTDVIPKFWVTEVIARLRAATVISRLVRRDFSQAIAAQGDTVNIPKRGTVTVRDKTAGNPITSDKPDTNKVAVVLDKHRYVSWSIEDAAGAKAVKSGLEYLDDAVPALAENIDAELLTLYSDLDGQTGSAGTDLDFADLMTARKLANDQLIPMSGRVGILSTKDEKTILNENRIIEADKRGDGGSALRDARIGRVLGVDWYMSQLTQVTGSGPASTHNMMFHPNAFALVTRALPAPPADSGARSAVVTDPVTGLTFRYTQAYSAKEMATIHTVDVLFGVKTVDSRLGVELLA